MKPNNVWKQISSFLFTVALSILLAACGGGSSNSSNNTTTPASASQGVLVDAAVEGIRYETTTQSGLTDAAGTFDYLPGEVVKFYIGDILLGSATGAGTLTPIDLVSGATDETNPQVTNILRFLQSLDSDSNLANGIQVSGITRLALSGQLLDFTQTETDFENAFNALSGAMLGGVALVTAADAQAHMRAFLDTLTGGGGGSGGSQGLGSVSVAGADASTIGSSFVPNLATPFFTATTGSVSWMGGNTDASNVNRLSGLNVSTINGQISLLQFDLQDARSTPLLSYSYNISCWPVVAADCSKISFDTSGKRLVLNNVTLMNRVSVVITNQATGPITLNGTLYWE